MTKKSSGQAAVSWWQEEGEEECPHCGQLYIYEVEFRCIECDGPGCPHCQVLSKAGRLVCVACASSCDAGEPT